MGPEGAVNIVRRSEIAQAAEPDEDARRVRRRLPREVRQPVQGRGARLHRRGHLPAHAARAPAPQPRDAQGQARLEPAEEAHEHSLVTRGALSACVGELLSVRCKLEVRRVHHMKRAVLALCLTSLAGVVAAGAMAACSSSSGGNGRQQPRHGHRRRHRSARRGRGWRRRSCPRSPCTDTVASVYADPGDVSGKAKGAILKCAKDKDMTARRPARAAVNVVDDAGDRAYSGTPFTSGAHVYRILYRTERGDPKNTPGVLERPACCCPRRRGSEWERRCRPSSRAHGSRGQAAKCAPSLDDPAASVRRGGLPAPGVPAGRLGLPGHRAGPRRVRQLRRRGQSAAAAYDDALDVGKSMLDGARAIRKVIPSSVTEQGRHHRPLPGRVHRARGARAGRHLRRSTESIAAVAVYSPLWISQQDLGRASSLEPSHVSASPRARLGAGEHLVPLHAQLPARRPRRGARALRSRQGRAPSRRSSNNDCWSASYPDLRRRGQRARTTSSARPTHRRIAYAAVPPRSAAAATAAAEPQASSARDVDRPHDGRLPAPHRRRREGAHPRVRTRTPTRPSRPTACSACSTA